MRMEWREASQHFTKVIKAIKAGQQVVLTERGKPIAVMTPLAAPDDWEAGLRKLEAAGVLRRAARPGPMKRFRPITIKGEPISATLRRERDER